MLHQQNGTVFEGDTNASTNSSSATPNTDFSATSDREEGRSSYAEGRRPPPQAATATARKSKVHDPHYFFLPLKYNIYSAAWSPGLVRCWRFSNRLQLGSDETQLGRSHLRWCGGPRDAPNSTKLVAPLLENTYLPTNCQTYDNFAASWALLALLCSVLVSAVHVRGDGDRPYLLVPPPHVPRK